jgi:hypothetical protein
VTAWRIVGADQLNWILALAMIGAAVSKPRPSPGTILSGGRFRSSPFSSPGYAVPMPDAPKRLTPATPEDVAGALAFALRYQGRKRVHNADEIMGEIVAKRLVERLGLSGFVVMKKPPLGRHSALFSRGHEGR